MIYGSCAPELQSIAIKVLSQTTSASNCERNWSTFSYIHTKTRNRLKYQKLQKLVFTFYNMKLRMRHNQRRSQEEIENSFNPINLDYIFQEDDPLSPWVEEREGPLLDGPQNSEWLPRMDTDDEEAEGGDDSASNEDDSHSGGGGGLSPPSNNSGDGGGGEEESDHNINEDREHYPYQETSYPMHNQGFVIDMIGFQDRGHSDSRRGGSHSTRSGRQHVNVLEDSSSSNISRSFGDFGIGESSESSQGHYPPYYQHPSYMPHYHYPNTQVPPYYQSSNYPQPYYHQAPGHPLH